MITEDRLKKETCLFVLDSDYKPGIETTEEKKCFSWEQLEQEKTHV